jgi:hypothetical protein
MARLSFADANWLLFSRKSTKPAAEINTLWMLN